MKETQRREGMFQSFIRMEGIGKSTSHIPTLTSAVGTDLVPKIHMSFHRALGTLDTERGRILGGRGTSHLGAGNRQYVASQVVLVVKNPPANAGDTRDVGLIPGSGRSPGGGTATTSVFLPGESHGQRSMVGFFIESQRVRHD